MDANGNSDLALDRSLRLVGCSSRFQMVVLLSRSGIQIAPTPLR